MKPPSKAAVKAHKYAMGITRSRFTAAKVVSGKATIEWLYRENRTSRMAYYSTIRRLALTGGNLDDYGISSRNHESTSTEMEVLQVLARFMTSPRVRPVPFWELHRVAVEHTGRILRGGVVGAILYRWVKAGLVTEGPDGTYTARPMLVHLIGQEQEAHEPQEGVA